MPTKTTKKSTKRASTSPKSPAAYTAKDFWGFSAESALTLHTEAGSGAGNTGKVQSVGVGRALFLRDRKNIDKELARCEVALTPWQRERLEKSIEAKEEFFCFSGENGPVWILAPMVGSLAPVDKKPATAVKEHHGGQITANAYARARDLCAGLIAQAESFGLKELHVDASRAEKEQCYGLIVGLELACYSFKSTVSRAQKKAFRPLPKIYLQAPQCEASAFLRYRDLGIATNLARHCTNLPPADLNPESYAEAVEALFLRTNAKLETPCRVEIFDRKRLEKERMNLILAVGAGATAEPRVIRLSYRGAKLKSKKNLPEDLTVLLGKGVTFDSGGLDIKPASGMRWMKKDMAGSSSVLAVMWYAARQQLEVDIDAYLALAENAVDAKSFRPGDIVESRSGLRVEIHNTDAEGRLVLADIMTYAQDQAETEKRKVSAMIDVATLTGAIKVGLGADVPGLFCNDDELSQQILDAAKSAGEKMWRMPLVEEYARELHSASADLVNASQNGFGGAITAALFLKRFVRCERWAHLDIYGWVDGATGAFRESGGNGQLVQSLAKLMGD